MAAAFSHILAFALGGLAALALMTLARWWEKADRLAVRRHEMARRAHGRVRGWTGNRDCGRRSDGAGMDGLEG